MTRSTPASSEDWPTRRWPTGPLLRGDPRRLDAALDAMFGVNPNPGTALSLACVVVQDGRIVAERYGPDVTSTTPLISWSTAKSITHAAVGVAVADGLVALDEPVRLPQWRENGDPRSAITLRDLLAMRSGLEFCEDYIDGDSSHCIEMLFGPSSHDMAAYAASLPLEHPVGTSFNYSSGSTNIVSRVISDAYGFDRAAMQDHLRRRLFGPLGMCSATATFDDAGTFVGSSYVHATAQDYARFGLLYLRDGVWDGERVLPEGWVDYGRTVTSVDEDTGLGYGAHWWVWDDAYGTFAAHGYEGQLIAVVPDLDAVVVRLGKTPAELRPALMEAYRDVVSALA